MPDRTPEQPDGPYPCRGCGDDITDAVKAERGSRMDVLRTRRSKGPRTWSVWITCTCGTENVVNGRWQAP